MAENANVRVVVNALTEAAEQNIDEVGDEISGLGDDAAVGQTALDQLSDEFGEATAQSMILQRAMSELDDDIAGTGNSALYAQTALDQMNDELTETSTRAASSSGMLSGLSASMFGTATASSVLSTAFTLSLIPAILTLTTVMAPLVAGFAALAAGALALGGAFAAIIGSGILAFGQKKAQQNKKELAQTKRLIAQYESLKQQTGSLTAAQQQRLEQLRKKKKRLEEQTTIMGALGGAMSDLKEELIPIIAGFGQEFIPLIEDALDAIPTLVRRMVDAVGGTEMFRKALRDFGAAAMEVIPALTGFMFDLARRALPLAREFFNFLGDKAPGAVQAIADNLAELEPEFRALLDALIEAAPVLLEFGTNVAEVVVPAIEDAVRGLTAFMELVNGLPEPLQGASIGMLILLPLIIKFAGTLATVSRGLKWVIGLLGSAITYFSSASTATGALANAASWLAGALSTAVTWLTTTVAGGAALGAAIGLVVTKILDMLGVFDMIGDAAAWLQSVIGKDLVDVFLTAASVLSLGLIPALGSLGGIILGVIRGDLGQAVQNAKRILGRFFSAFQNVIGMIVDGLFWLESKILQLLGSDGRIIMNVLAGLGRMLRAAVGWGADFVGRMVNGLVNYDWVGLGSRMVTWFGNAMVSVFKAAVDWGKKLVMKIADGIASAPDAIGKAIAKKTPFHDKGQEGLVNIKGSPINVPFLQEGGVVQETGLAVVHKGETVIPPDIGRADADKGVKTRRVRRDSGGDGGTTINGGITMRVDAAGHVQNNPYQWSRVAAQQLQRETRQQYGATD